MNEIFINNQIGVIFALAQGDTLGAEEVLSINLEIRGDEDDGGLVFGTTKLREIGVILFH